VPVLSRAAALITFGSPKSRQQAAQLVEAWTLTVTSTRQCARGVGRDVHRGDADVLVGEHRGDVAGETLAVEGVDHDGHRKVRSGDGRPQSTASTRCGWTSRSRCRFAQSTRWMLTPRPSVM